ncbi:hypothetical protein C8Q70DRAFT_105709 [Cubamyces menziesii]|nr:hypothetical protein C8Q70DRAFT_105709 [Cubamyces menziesii]
MTSTNSPKTRPPSRSEASHIDGTAPVLRHRPVEMRPYRSVLVIPSVNILTPLTDHGKIVAGASATIPQVRSERGLPSFYDRFYRSQSCLCRSESMSYAIETQLRSSSRPARVHIVHISDSDTHTAGPPTNTSVFRLRLRGLLRPPRQYHIAILGAEDPQRPPLVQLRTPHAQGLCCRPLRHRDRVPEQRRGKPRPRLSRGFLGNSVRSYCNFAAGRRRLRDLYSGNCCNLHTIAHDIACMKRSAISLEATPSCLRAPRMMTNVEYTSCSMSDAIPHPSTHC